MLTSTSYKELQKNKYFPQRKSSKPNEPIQKPGARDGTPILDLLVRGILETPKQCRLFPLLLVAQQNLMVNPCCWRYQYFGCRIWRNQIGADLKASSLLTNFYSTRQHYVSCWEGNVTNSLTQLWALWASYNDRHDDIAHGCSGAEYVIQLSNSFLAGFKDRSTGENSCLQRCRVGEFKDPQGEPATLILLNIISILCSKFVSLYP
jgi:hypothetical protein